MVCFHPAEQGLMHRRVCIQICCRFAVVCVCIPRARIHYHKCIKRWGRYFVCFMVEFSLVFMLYNSLSFHTLVHIKAELSIFLKCLYICV